MTQSHSLDLVRASAQKAFASLPDPTTQYGLDIRSPFAIDYHSISTHAQSEPPHSIHEIRSDGVIIADLSTALKNYPEKLARVGSLLSLSDKLESFHASHLQHGLFVFVPARVNVPGRIVLPSPAHTFSHVFVLAAPHSRASFFMHDNTASPARFRSTVVEVIAETDAHIAFTSLQTLPSDHHHFTLKRAHVDAHGKVVWSYGELGSAVVKGDASAHLMGESATLHTTSLLLGNASQQFDIHDGVHHLSPDTHSVLRSRAVLDNAAKLVYRALLKMVKEAPGSVGNQRADALLLSPSAEADPVPGLEIEGSDVRCSHAATVGRLDKDKLFYLTSRGLDESTARAIYIHGFVESALSFLPLSDESAHVFRAAISAKLGFTREHDAPAPRTEVLV